jgi:hypothetical protein
MAINPATGIDDGLDIYGKKKQPAGTGIFSASNPSSGSQVPTVDPNASNAVVPLSKAATSGAAVAAPALTQPTVAPVTDTTKGNEDVLKTAQTSVLNQPSNTALQGQTQGAVSNWLTNPMGDFDPAKNKQQQLEKSNSDWANSFDAMKRQFGNVSGSGLLQKDMLGNMLQHNVDQSALESTIDKENYDKYVESMGKSIGAAQIQNKSDSDLYSQYLDNLGNVRGMAEGERSQDTVTADTAATIQGNKDLSAQGFSQDVQKLAIENGYDLNKLEKTYGYEATKAAVEHGYNLDVLAKTYGNDIAKMGVAQGYDLDKLTATYGLEATKAAVQQGYDLDKMSVAFGNDTAKLTLASNLDTASKSALMDLQDKIDTKTLLTENDFKKTEAELDRQLETFKAAGDWQNATNIENLKGQIAKQSQDAQNVFTQSMAETAHAWQTTDKLDSQVFDRATQTLAIAAEKAKQDDDIEAQKYLASEKSKLDLKMQTNEMTHDESMAYTNAQYAAAKDANDYNRQISIIDFQTIAALNLADRNGTIDEAKITLQGDINKALADKDYTKATALQKNQLVFDQTKLTQEKTISDNTIALEQKGVDLKAAEQQYNLLAAEVDAGRQDPSVLTAFMKGVADKAGVKLVPPDPQATQKAAQQKYDDMVNQYALTHPEAKPTYEKTSNFPASLDYPVDHVFGEMEMSAINQAFPGAIKAVIPPTAQESFNEFFNSATYGEMTSAEKKAKDEAGFNDIADLSNAVDGDKFDVKTPVKYQGDVTIPAGKYNVITKATESGSEFFGNKKTAINTYFVNIDTGEMINAGVTRSNAKGNFISQGWAGAWDM